MAIITQHATLRPVGQRPRCLNCQHELRPKFHRDLPPLSVPTGQMETVQVKFGTQPEYEERMNYRSLTAEERKQWRKEHPRQFLGTYGD